MNIPEIDREIANVKKLRDAILSLYEFASKNIYLRLFAYIILIALFLTPSFVVVPYFEFENSRRIELKRMEIDLLVNKNMLQNATEKISICIDAEEKNFRLTDWYCEEAMKAYVQVSSAPDANQGMIDELLQKKAYGAMKNDILERDRKLVIGKFEREKEFDEKGITTQILGFVSNRHTILICNLLALAIATFIYFMLVLRARSKTKTVDAINELV